MASAETQAAMGALRNQIAADEGRAAELEEKIQRLETAKASVKDSYSDIKSFVDWVGNYDVGTSWLGENREKFEERKTQTKEAGDTLVDSVEEKHEQIDGKLKQLKSELSDCRNSIGWASFKLGCMEFFGF